MDLAQVLQLTKKDLIVEREKYTPSAYAVKTGFSGLAQVKMRRDHDPAMKTKYDHEYAKNFNLWLDIKLFVQTVFRHNDGAR